MVRWTYDSLHVDKMHDYSTTVVFNSHNAEDLLFTANKELSIRYAALAGCATIQFFPLSFSRNRVPDLVV